MTNRINFGEETWILALVVAGCSSFSATTVISNNDAGAGDAGTTAGGSKNTGGSRSSGGSTSGGVFSNSGGKSSLGGSSSVGGTSSAGGTIATGGAANGGNSTSSGGISATGGISNPAGTATSGGTTGTGGVAASGGLTTTGETSSKSGSTAIGGVASTGGTPATGGISAAATGGLAATGGTLATGGSTSTLKALGATCSAANQCTTNLCVDSVCCESDCTGTCKQCTVGTGKCDTTPATDVGCPTVTCPANTTCLSYVAPTAGKCKSPGACATISDCTLAPASSTSECGTGSLCDGQGNCKNIAPCFRDTDCPDVGTRCCVLLTNNSYTNSACGICPQSFVDGGGNNLSFYPVCGVSGISTATCPSGTTCQLVSGTSLSVCM